MKQLRLSIKNFNTISKEKKIKEKILTKLSIKNFKNLLNLIKKQFLI